MVLAVVATYFAAALPSGPCRDPGPDRGLRFFGSSRPSEEGAPVGHTRRHHRSDRVFFLLLGVPGGSKGRRWRVRTPRPRPGRSHHRGRSPGALRLKGRAALASAPSPDPYRRRGRRDLVRYQSRSGSALAAITIGVLIAVIVCVVASARYGNVLDYAGPNVASNQLIVYTPQAPAGSAAEPQGHVIGPNSNGTSSIIPNASASTGTPPSPQSTVQTVHGLAQALDASSVELDTTSANLQHDGSRPSVLRPDLPRHTGAAEGVRHQPVVDRPRRRHPHIAPGLIGNLEHAADVWRLHGTVQA